MLFRECTQKFLPTAASFCFDENHIGESEGRDGLLDCLEESLEVTAAERCLALSQSYGEDVVEDVVEDGVEDKVVKILTNGAACLIQTQENATIVLEKFLDLEISKVSINYDGLNTFERPGSVGGRKMVL